MIDPASAAQSRETSGGVAVATGSLASVSMECGPGSVTGCSAVNNDLVVCAAQECCNVWEYSTLSKGGVGGAGSQFLYELRSGTILRSSLERRKPLLANTMAGKH